MSMSKNPSLPTTRHFRAASVLALFIAASVVLSGCAHMEASLGFAAYTPSAFDTMRRNSDGFASDLSHVLCESRRHGHYCQAFAPGPAPVLDLVVATPQKSDDMSETGQVGLMAQSLLQSSLVTAGFGVIQVPLRKTLQVNASGELMLSRAPSQIASSVPAQVVVTGTWLRAGEQYVVTFSAVRVGDRMILADRSFSLPALDE